MTLAMTLTLPLPKQVAFRTVALANSVAFVTILLLLIFAGFYMELDQLPPWCAWLKYLSYLYWGFSGMLVNEFSGRELPCAAQRIGEYAAECPFSGAQRMVQPLPSP
jgi:ABC-type multidrug transport system permease subunit